MNLADHSSRAVMKAINRTKTNGWPDNSPEAAEIVAAINEAEARVASRPHSVSVFLPKVQVINNMESSWLGLRDKRAKIYVVSLALDLSGEAQQDTARDTGGAPPEALVKGTAGEIFEGVSRTASAKLVVRSTPLFSNILDRDSLPLLGNGICLYTPKDPGGLLELHGVIMEDDKAFRDLGKYIEQAAAQFDMDNLIASLLRVPGLHLGDSRVLKLRGIFSALFSVVVELLTRNRDDVIQDFHFSALAHQSYLKGIHPFETRNAKGHLMVDLK
jgi:hypothetical protein